MSLIKNTFLSILIALPCWAAEFITVGYGDTLVAESERIHDDSGNLIELNDTTGIYTFAYDDQNRLIEILYPIGITTHFSYNDDGLISDIYHQDPVGFLFLSYRYEYDSGGRQLLKERFRDGSLDLTLYSYTPEGFLARVNYSSGDFEAYTYDELGNRLTSETRRGFVDYEYDGDLLIRAGNTRYSYDEAGYLCEREYGDVHETYTYDDRGFLASLDGEVGKITFTYNEEGDRICKSCTSDIEYTPLDTSLLGFESRVRTPLIYDGDLNYYCYADKIIASAHPDTQLFYLYDYPDGSIGAVINQELECYTLEYESFGISRTRLSHLGFNGEWLDFETGLYYLCNRYYDPEIGRFITPDPLDNHPYAYCYNDPVNFVDPLGLWGWGKSNNGGKSSSSKPPKPPKPPKAPKPPKPPKEPKPPKAPKPPKPPKGSKPPKSAQFDPYGPYTPPSKETKPKPPQPAKPPAYSANSSPPSPSKTSSTKPSLPPTPPQNNNKIDADQAYIRLYSQNPSLRNMRSIPDEKSKTGHVMTEVELPDGTKECRGTYMGKEIPVDDGTRAKKPGTKCIEWKISEEQAEKARKKQSEQSNYNLIFNNCGDRARTVLEEAEIPVPVKTGVTTPKQVGKWIDEQNKKNNTDATY